MNNVDLPAIDVPLLPSHFQGRRHLVHQVCDRLRQPELLSSQLVGGPKSGKTSLLRYLASQLTNEALGSAAQAMRVYVDATVLGTEAKPDHFWMLVCRELKASPGGDALIAGHATLGGLLTQALDRARAGTLDIFDLQDLFDGFAALQQPVVLLVDEFDAVIANTHFLPPAEFFNQVRNLCNRVPRGLAFVATTVRPLSDVGGATAGPSPPYNHFATIPMDPISDGDVRAQLEWVAQRCNVSAPDGTWQWVARASRGQPMLVSYLVRKIVDALAAGRSFDDQQLNAFVADPDGPYARLNQAILAALTARERQVVQAWLADPDSVTAMQRELLQRLRKYALLPPGVEV